MLKNKKMKKCVFAVFALIVLKSNDCICQSTIAGVYVSETKDVLLQSQIQIGEGGRYFFQTTGDRHYVSKGYWTRKGNILFLHDSIESGFDILVEERFDSSLKTVKFNEARYRDSDTEINAYIQPNCDSTQSCLITTKECDLKLGSLVNFRLLVENFASKIYQVRSPLSNVFDIRIQSDYPFYLYKPLTGYKILLGENSTLQLSENKIGSKYKAIVFKKTVSLSK